MDISPFVRIETTAFKERQSMIDKINEIISECNDFDDDISGKADKSDTYTKTEINNKLSLKADKSDTYTKSQVNTILNTDYYTKSAIDDIIDNIEVDLDDYYNKSETDSLLDDKCDVADYYDKTAIDYMFSHITSDGIKDVTDLVNYSFNDKRITADVKTGDIIFINAVAELLITVGTTVNVNINYCGVLDSTGKNIRYFDLVDIYDSGVIADTKSVYTDVTDSIATLTPTETRYIDMDVTIIDLSDMRITKNRVQSITLNTFKVLRGE